MTGSKDVWITKWKASDLEAEGANKLILAIGLFNTASASSFRWC